MSIAVGLVGFLMIAGTAETARPGGGRDAPLRQGESGPHSGYTVYHPERPADQPVPNDDPGSLPVVKAGEILIRLAAEATLSQQDPEFSSIAAAIDPVIPPSHQGAVRLQGQPADSPPSVFRRLFKVSLKPGVDLKEAVRTFQEDPRVRYAEPNYRLRIAREAHDGRLPNDFHLPKLWGLHNTGQSNGNAGADIDAPRAWRLTQGDPSVVVAVIDTGIDYFHPDLADNTWVNPEEVRGNGIDDDENGYVDDVHGYDFVFDDSDPMDDHNHGTHIAGTIGAVGDNDLGISGVAWQVSLMALKAFDRRGNSQIADTIQAIHYAIDNGAQIINASWGETIESQSLREAIETARQSGVLVIAAAGNSNDDEPFYPAAFPETIAVAATDPQDRKTRFSNHGPFVDVAAPGKRIYSTLFNNQYGFLSGSSMAAAHVSGVATLVTAQNPLFSNNEVANILKNAADPVDSEEWIGLGRINARRALEMNSPLPEIRLDLPETVAGMIDIQGSVEGRDLSEYSLAYGKGRRPDEWVEFHTGDQAVSEGPLMERFDTAPLDEGTYSLRLTASNEEGNVAREDAFFEVGNVSMHFPQNNDILRHGTELAVRGNVFGRGRTFDLEWGTGADPEDWFQDGITLTEDGTGPILNGVLAEWDTSFLEPNSFYTLRLTAQGTDGSTDTVSARFIYVTDRLKPGWPRHITIEGEFPERDWRHLQVADLSGDGTQEIILLDHGTPAGKPAELMVFAQDGSRLWSRQLDSGEPFSDIPAVGDLDGNGSPEIVVSAGSSGQIHAFRSDGSPMPGDWPHRLEPANWGKVLADLNRDDQLEIIAYSQESIDQHGRKRRHLTVLDADGKRLAHWDNLQGCSHEKKDQLPEQLPAVANLDGEPDLEIVAVSGCHTVAAYKLGREGRSLWQTRVEGVLLSSPVIGDIDNDGSNEIVLAAYTEPDTSEGGLYVIDAQGEPVPGWPVLVNEAFLATPALADFTGDQQLEICIPGWESQYIHLVRASGFELPGWPVGPVRNASLRSTPTIGDINGDADLDVILSTPGFWFQGVRTGDPTRLGGIQAWDIHGTSIDLDPHPSLTGLLFEASGGQSSLRSAPVTLTDLDNDGNLDLVLASIRDAAYSPEPPFAERKGRSTLYAWELATPYSPERFPWPRYQANRRHSGFLPPPPEINEPPTLSEIPGQTIRQGDSFVPIDLDQYVDDPNDAAEDLTWNVSENSPLETEVTDDQVLRVTPPGDWIGEESLRLSVTDPGGLSDHIEVRFAVRLEHTPPIAKPDRVQTLEDVPVEIDALRNDSDPNGTDLTLETFSQPRLGRVETTESSQTLRFIPHENEFGRDHFQYTIRTSDGATAIGRVEITIEPVNDPPHTNEFTVIANEDTPVEIDPLGNDEDPEGDPFSLTGWEEPTKGTVSEQARGILHYTPPRHFNGLVSFNYEAEDIHGTGAQGTIRIRVKPVNDAPEAFSQEFTLNKNTKQEIEWLAEDPDNDELTFSVVEPPQNGELLAFPQVAEYKPRQGFSGSDAFTYVASDGRLKSEEATVTLEILDHNNPPKAESQRLTTKQSQRLPVTLTASDPDEDPLSFKIVASPSHGRLEGTPPGLTYHPDPGFKGEDDFRFQASDGEEPSRPAEIMIEVTDQNTAPVAEEMDLKTKIERPVDLTLEAFDPENNPLQYEIVEEPRHGTLEGSPPDLTYIPQPGFIGSDRFEFRVSDGALESEAATVTIEIAPLNEAPEVTEETITLTRNQSATFDLAVTDPDNDPLEAVILEGPQKGRLTGSGTTFTYRPDQNFAGTDEFSFRVWDGATYSLEGHVTLSVRPQAPDRPVLAFKAIDRLQSGAIRIRLQTPPDQSFAIEASNDLKNWDRLLTHTTTKSNFLFVDSDSIDSPRRFYRLVRLEPPADQREDRQD